MYEVVQGFRLSPQQRRLWQWQGNAAFRSSCVVRLEGPLDLSVLRRAMQNVIERHEVLRTFFHCRSDMSLPLQRIVDEGTPDWRIEDLTALNSEAQEARIEELVQLSPPFDLGQGPLLRIECLQLSAGSHALIITLPSLCADSRTLRNMVHELRSCYESNDLPEPTQYVQFSEWQNELQEEDDDSGRNYWRRLFDGASLPTTLPYEKRNRAGFEPDSVVVSLKPGLTSDFLLACWQTLLWRLTRQQSIVVAVQFDGRKYEELNEALGLFATCLPVQQDFADDPPFSKILESVSETCREADAWQEYFNWEECFRTESDQNFFPLHFSFEEWPPVLIGKQAGDLRFSFTRHDSCIERFKLKLRCINAGDSLSAEFHFDSGSLAKAHVQLIARCFERLVESVTANPESRARDFEILSEHDAQQLSTWSRPAPTDYPAKSMQQLFEEQAVRTPEAEAIVCKGERLSYAQFNARANRLARYLRQRGVGPNVIVGLCVNRSLEMLVGLWGVLKAGGAYLPLEPEHPPARLAYQLSESKSQVLLTQEAMLDVLPEFDGEVVCLDRDWQRLESESEEDLPHEAAPEDLAYVIFTSGSTGKPKGVQIAHRNLVNYSSFMSHTLTPNGEQLQFATVSTLSADLGNTCIFPSLISGGCLHILDYEIATDGDKFADYLTESPIDVLKIVPSHLNALLPSLQIRNVFPRKYLMLGGETFSFDLLRRVSEVSGDCRIINHYGPTETTIGSLIYPVGQADETWSTTVPIGRPIANTEIQILDERRRPVPPGLVAELYIGGAGLAQGYLGQPEQTNARFVPNPFSSDPAERLYRTGDLARYLPDGNVEFCGRVDHQVKIRGYRIELGEIENALREHANVREAIVQASEDEHGHKHLIAYCVPQHEPAPLSAELANALKQKLPAYMIPQIFINLKTMPLTPNGKVDHRRLPAPGWSRATSGTRVAPRQAVESALIDIWSEVLNVEQVGAHDNFFDLGGHSLLAMQVCSRVRKVFGIELPLRNIFETPTPAGLGNRVTAALSTSEMPDIPLVRVARSGSLPLSFAQQRLWFIDRLEGGQSAFYNITIALRLRGPLDLNALERTLKALVQRHEVLRTRFVEVDGEPVQLIEDNVQVALKREDLSALPAAERELVLERLAASETQRPFDLAAGPLLRALRAQMGADDHAVMLTMHHIISDGWSRGVLVREMAALYTDFAAGGSGESVLEELPVQYADFAVWQRRWLQGEVLDKQLDYWRRQLAGAPQLLELPADKPRPTVQTHRGATHARQLPKSLASSLKELSRREGATMFMTLLAAFQTLLYRYSGQEDIVIGSPIANRARAETESLIGFFTNTLVFRTLFAGDPSFADLLRRVRETALGTYAHQDVPFEMIIEELQPERSLSYTPLFQVMFDWRNAPRESIELPGLTVGPLGREHTSAKFDLTLLTFETEQGITTVFEYSTDLFEEPTIARMARHFENLLMAVATAPEQRVSTIVLLDEEEQRRLLEAGRGELTDYRQTACVHELFEQQAARTPEAVALIYEEQQLTYRELDWRSDRLAARLQALGIGPESVVGLLAERSPEMVVGLLAVLKVGGAYLPLDPAAPPARLSFMIKDASVALVLLHGKFRACLANTDQQPLCVEIDELASDEAKSTEATAPLKSGVSPDNLVYVIYTSGSTGWPKGVLITHRGVVNYLGWAIAAYRAGEGQGSPVQSPLVFDLTVTSLFATLLAGRAVRLLPEPGVETLATALRSNFDFTFVKLTPSHLEVLARQLAPNEAGGRTRAFVIGGEALFGDALRFWQRHAPTTRLINEYGPTETVVGCCVYEVPEGQETSGKVPIGRPVANTQMYILDRRLQPVPMGVRGELYVGGEGVGRGYLNRPALTAERFVPHPFSAEPGMRLYRTGDLARYSAEGNIEYLGRTDDQVKIRGYRIEPGELESALLSYPSIRECSVSSAKNGSGEEQLVAYVVAHEGLEISKDELRQALTDRLPAYMIPTVFVFLHELPRTPNGKVDRRALPAIEHARAAASDFAEPRNRIESQLAQIWEDLLNIRPIGINQNFFELGGHSLMASRLFSRIHEAFQVELPLKTIFDSPVLSDLASVIEKVLRMDSAAIDSPLVPVARDRELPLSFGQHGLWLTNRLDPHSHLYNMPTAMRLKGLLDVAALERCLVTLTERHESLRTVFKEENGKPRQLILQSLNAELNTRDLRHLPETEREAEAHRVTVEQALKPFDLEHGPLWRTAILQLGDENYVLLFVMHHIISDGWSLEVLGREVATLYESYLRGLSPSLPALPIQYADYAFWQRETFRGERWDQQLSYWRRKLDRMQILRLPIQRSSARTDLGAVDNIHLSSSLSASLATLSRREGVTLFITLLAAFKTLLYRYTGQDDIVVASPMTNRGKRELENLIGYFVNTVPLRTDLSGNPTFRDLLSRVRHTTLDAYAHQDLPLQTLLKELQIEREVGRAILFPAVFNMQNAPMSVFSLPNVTISAVNILKQTIPADLYLNAMDVSDGIIAGFKYNVDLFTSQMIAELLANFAGLLEAVVAQPECRLLEIPFREGSKIRAYLEDQFVF